MPNGTHPVERALGSGSRAKSFATKIKKLCAPLPVKIADISDNQRSDIIRLAAACRSTKAVIAVLSISELPSIDKIPEFKDIFCETYYPVMEDGKRGVGFWSIKDAATLAKEDVHEWVRERRQNKKTMQYEVVPVPFATWWRTHKPDYVLYGVAGDRAQWNKRIIMCGKRPSVNMMYDNPPVLTEQPKKYGDGVDALAILNEVLSRTITDADPVTAHLKRVAFVLDAGSHLLALRDFGAFRCRKIFCFTSTNAGQGTGKTFLHESLSALVPRDASCTVPTTELAGTNLLALYGSSVCILTEAPSTSSDRYTAEDVKSFADAGWKTATEKYVAKRPVNDNSLKLLSSNHYAPLPVDSTMSRRMEFFVSSTNDDGGAALRILIDEVEQRNGWDGQDVRRCVGWALLEMATALVEGGYAPCAVARRTIDSRHILSESDYEHFVIEDGNTTGDYSEYRDFRGDHGYTWSPDIYRYTASKRMSKSVDSWNDGLMPVLVPVTPPDHPDTHPPDTEEGPTEEAASVEKKPGPAPFTGFQYKSRVKKGRLESETLSISEIYSLVVNDPALKLATENVRSAVGDKQSRLKKETLPQIFPSTMFRRFSRRATMTGFTGFTHIDFDYIAEGESTLTPAQIRDALSELPGFVIGAISSRANGAWAIFYAGDKIKDETTYTAAVRSLYSMCEDAVSMLGDESPRRPTTGRVLGYDPECCIAAEAVFGDLPAPYPWKAPSFSVIRADLENAIDVDMSDATRASHERFMEVVVDKSCAKVQAAGKGERHGAAIKAVSNVVLCCKERGLTPLCGWGRRLSDACLSSGLPRGEVADIMKYWQQETGLSV